MKVTSIKDAWAEANKIFPTDYEHDASRSERAGYPIYYSTAAGVNAWISDLGNHLEVNLPDGKSVDIWIEAPVEAPVEATATSNSTEDTGSATKEERRETAKRIQRLTYYYTEEYVREMDNKKARGRRRERNAGRRNRGQGNQVHGADRREQRPRCDGV